MEKSIHAEHIILEDDVVLLRTLERTDFEHLLHFAVEEPEIWKFSLVAVEGEAGLRNYLDTAMDAREAGIEYPFIVFDKRNNQYAGSTRFYVMELENGSVLLGYTWYGNAFQGTGLNKHCKFLLLQYAFEILMLERVEFRADIRNHRSVAAMKSIGCTVEGVLRSNTILREGGRRDTIVLSILKTEWFATVKANLLAKL